MIICYSGITYMHEHTPSQSKETSELSPRELSRLRFSHEWQRRAGRTTQKIAATALAATFLLQTDILLHKHELDASDPRIHSIEQSDDELNQTGIVFIDGFGGQNGSWAARSLESPITSMVEGDLLALEQDKDGISIKAVAREIANYAEQKQLTSLSLYGYSLGGVQAIKVAAILRDTYGITVPFIFLDRVPSSGDMIKKKLRGQAIAFLDTVNAFHIKGTDIGIDIEYSRILRGLFNAASPNDISHLNNSSTPFIIDQLSMGMTANTDADIAELASDELPQPVMVYISSPHPEKDYFVDLTGSEEEFRQSAIDAGLDFVTISVDAIHSRPDLSQPEYQAAYESMADELSLRRDTMNERYLFANGVTKYQQLYPR